MCVFLRQKEYFIKEKYLLMQLYVYRGRIICFSVVISSGFCFFIFRAERTKKKILNVRIEFYLLWNIKSESWWGRNFQLVFWNIIYINLMDFFLHDWKFKDQGYSNAHGDDYIGRVHCAYPVPNYPSCQTARYQINISAF